MIHRILAVAVEIPRSSDDLACHIAIRDDPHLLLCEGSQVYIYIFLSAAIEGGGLLSVANFSAEIGGMYELEESVLRWGWTCT